MEACIEALFTIDGEADKRKTHEMIRVLKGAISVSKSRTGEVIYRYNRHEKKALTKTMAKFDKDTARSQVHINSLKRDVLRKWNLVFGRQRRFTESMRGFDDMLKQAISTRHLLKDEENPKGEEQEEEGGGEGGGEEKKAEEEEKKAEVEEEQVSKMPLISDPRARRFGMRQLARKGIVATPVTVGLLPKLNAGAGLHNARIETEEEERQRKEKAVEEERQRKARELPRFDKELMEAYLTEQRTLHEDLLTRNTLLKIKSSVDKDHVFFKYRLKSKLPASAPDLLQSIERERSAVSTVTWAGSQSGCGGVASRSGVSTRHSSTRRGLRLRSSRSNKSSRSGGKEELLEEAGLRLGKLSLTSRDPASSPPPDLASSQVSDLPRLERARTVHFS